MTQKPFRLNPGLDGEMLATRYRERRRLQISNFLHEEDAECLYRSLREANDWKLVINQGEKLFELDRAAQAALSPEQRAALDKAIYKSARTDFQYQYETIRVPDGKLERKSQDSPLSRFAQLLCSGPAISFLKTVAGEKDINFADAQATAYGPGHFLTRHDDAVEGKNRRAAYVFNLTPAWRSEWGGLLLFHGSDEQIEQGFSPVFNALNIFSVPQPHSVSSVAPFAAYRRYSVTGWLRAGKQPE
jgi:Rps23 Pro-64 3,4-dihydroxylase Tpa1-like proline 4-hydroxylase